MTYELVLDKTLGLNNVKSPVALEPFYLTKAKNVFVDNNHKLVRRPAEDKLTDIGGIHSLWSDGDVCLFRSGAAIYRMYEDGNIEILHAGDELNNSLTMDYIKVVDRIFMMDGVNGFSFDISRGELYKIGIPIPQKPNLSLLVGGRLTAGIYRVKLGYIREDGAESGLSDYSEIVLTNNSKLRIEITDSNIPEDVAWYSIYITKPNGSIFYFIEAIPANEKVVEYHELRYTNIEPSTEGLSPMPSGNGIAFFNGRLWTSKINVLYYSDLFAFELTDPVKNMIQLNDYVLSIHSVGDNLLINCNDGIYMLYKDYHIRKIHSKPMVKGSMQTIDLHKLAYFDQPLTGLAVLGVSEDGILLCLTDGTILNLTEQTYRFSKSSEVYSCVDGNMFYFKLKED